MLSGAGCEITLDLMGLGTPMVISFRTWEIEDVEFEQRVV